ncbi:hypothetical protein EMIHUDRAFT_449524 [Emiliania huxleyi CCMP1516]|uniref:Uncharacterized protein n=2 Tax=Emiliania huxleyi TaxID=2903 RepID=A0A0D3K8N3_EMIH1|nr:hypothetical protein EMIHUDRAFT_449524 [Emiliania huxleyi CCMP1516]EOD32118.1 hypothetical protein EMIHUDRAFT_449524 [Emiliania huxleyi CCMP1516]|eukprot:XP_005784547.1 hypothetical protein EMIHUDRAFT_449524 [Emiliania huxleyi CCMP1516]
MLSLLRRRMRCRLFPRMRVSRTSPRLSAPTSGSRVATRRRRLSMRAHPRRRGSQPACGGDQVTGSYCLVSSTYDHRARPQSTTFAMWATLAVLHMTDHDPGGVYTRHVVPGRRSRGSTIACGRVRASVPGARRTRRQTSSGARSFATAVAIRAIRERRQLRGSCLLT